MPDRKKKASARSVRPLTAQQQLQLRQKARQELARLDALNADPAARQMVEDFKTKFSTCEIVYKVVLADFSQAKYGEKPDRMLVTMTQAPFALAFAGYDFDKNLLTQLFGSEERIGKRSAKKLRDSLTHSMNQKAVDELTHRHAELYRYMDAFLNKIRDFDFPETAGQPTKQGSD